MPEAFARYSSPEPNLVQMINESTFTNSLRTCKPEELLACLSLALIMV